MSLGIAVFCVALVVLYLTLYFAKVAGFVDPYEDFDSLIGLIAVALIAAAGVFLWGMS